MNFYRPQTKFAKVMFLHLSVSYSVHRGYPSMPCRSPGGVYPSMPCRFPGPHPIGSLRGLARGVSRPTPKGELEGSGQRGLQAHTQGGLQAHTWGVSRPTPRGCIPACTQADSPLRLTATTGGTHPTGMHPCYRPQ